MAQAPTLYQQVADALEKLILESVFRVGERLPGTRKLAQRYDVSINTVLEAQSLLVERGLVESKSRSGFYVLNAVSELENGETAKSDELVRRQLPRSTHFKPSPSLFKNQDLVLRIVQTTSQPSAIQLGAALPDKSLLPNEALKKSMLKTLRKRGEDLNIYAFPPGDDDLIFELCKRMTRFGCEFLQTETVVTSGCNEALLLALKATTEPGDIVALESPTYYGLLQLVESLKLQAMEIPCDPISGINVQALEEACDKWPIKACVVVSNFSNPLGSCPNDKDKRRLAQLLENRGIPLIEDDIYGDLGFGSVRPRPIKAFDQSKNVIYCSSFSKSLSPGLRLGWICAGRFYAEVNYAKLTHSLASASYTQSVLNDFLKSGVYDKHLFKMRARLKTLVEQARHFILESFPDGTRVSKPAGGFVLWVTLPKRLSGMAVFDRAVSEGITIAPGQLFTSKSSYRQCIRINCALPWDEKLHPALVRLSLLTKSMI